MNFTHHIKHSQKGFSILMALGTTGILLIIVIGLASVFQREMKLSRLQYDGILSYAQAEGAFEYAMLKIRNHSAGFSDTMNPGSADSLVFTGSSPRTREVKVSYKIFASATGSTFPGGLDQYKIYPLFVGKCQGFLGSSTSCDPRMNMGTTQVTNLELLTTGASNDLSWSIVAQSGSENVSIAGTGKIDGTEVGTMRIQGEKCLDASGNTISCSGGGVAERIGYFYDLEGKVKDFLTRAPASKFKDTPIRDPYILIFTTGPSVDITLKTDTPFTLPETIVIAEGQKGDALQSIRFAEDKSKYFEALKYGVYSTQ